MLLPVVILVNRSNLTELSHRVHMVTIAKLQRPSSTLKAVTVVRRAARRTIASATRLAFPAQRSAPVTVVRTVKESTIILQSALVLASNNKTCTLIMWRT